MPKTVPKPELGHRFDPDTRFLLANDRTLLVWIRTAIGLLAGGLVVAHVGDHITTTQSVTAIGIIGTSIVTALTGYIRYEAADKAIREGRLPSHGYGLSLQVLAFVIIALALGLLLATDIGM